MISILVFWLAGDNYLEMKINKMDSYNGSTNTQFSDLLEFVAGWVLLNGFLQQLENLLQIIAISVTKKIDFTQQILIEINI